MEIKSDELQAFQNAFKTDYGVLLSDKEAKEALDNLTNFFSLLYQWDLEDRQKEMQIKGK